MAGQGPSLDVENPFTEQSVATIDTAAPDQLDAAIAAAHEAFPGWERTPAVERAEMLHEVAFVLPAVWNAVRGEPTRVTSGTLALLYVVPGALAMLVAGKLFLKHKPVALFVVIALMLLGRVGPPTLFAALVLR